MIKTTLYKIPKVATLFLNMKKIKLNNNKAQIRSPTVLDIHRVYS